MAPGGRDYRGSDRHLVGYAGCCCEEEVETQSEEEEGFKLWRETAATAKQLRGRLIFLSDHSVTHVHRAVYECTN